VGSVGVELTMQKYQTMTPEEAAANTYPSIPLI